MEAAEAKRKSRKEKLKIRENEKNVKCKTVRRCFSNNSPERKKPKVNRN